MDAYKRGKASLIISVRGDKMACLDYTTRDKAPVGRAPCLVPGERGASFNRFKGIYQGLFEVFTVFKIVAA